MINDFKETRNKRYRKVDEGFCRLSEDVDPGIKEYISTSPSLSCQKTRLPGKIHTIEHFDELY